LSYFISRILSIYCIYARQKRGHFTAWVRKCKFVLIQIHSLGHYCRSFCHCIYGNWSSVCAFISRFWLDRQNSDLSEVIRQQSAILQSTQDFEKEYALLQQRLATLKSMYSQVPGYTERLNSLASSTPPEIIYKTLSVAQDPSTKDVTVSLNVTALSEDSMVKFINNLTQNPDITSVNVGNIEKKLRESSYDLTINLKFNKTPKKTWSILNSNLASKTKPLIEYLKKQQENRKFVETVELGSNDLSCRLFPFIRH